MGIKSSLLIFLIISTALSSSFASEQRLNSHRLYRQSLKRGTFLFLEDENRFPKGWHHLGLKKDMIAGINNIQKLPKGKEIIVAVIDSGIDVNHKDLQGKIWVNQKEIPNNMIDDDHNGYIDDVMGWNFLGNNQSMAQFALDFQRENSYHLIPNPQANHVKVDTFEVTRQYRRLKLLTEQGENLSELQLNNLYQYETRVLSKRKRAKKLLDEFKLDEKIFLQALTALNKYGINKESLSIENLHLLKIDNPFEQMAKEALLKFLTDQADLGFIQEQINFFHNQYFIQYNPEIDPRAKLVDDNPSLLIEKGYGNNDVIGPDPLHGTHIAGIIAAIENPSQNSKGIAERVKVMPLRVLVDGDERDKDIINSIYYAVDNGANIINISFGKYISPRNTEVTQALEYAASKNVLVVLAAGNDYHNIDKKISYPHPFINDSTLKNCITVAASSPYTDEDLIAPFTNYGKKTVDIFAPGVFIQSILPNDKYGAMSGTSMSAPIVSAIAAVLWSQVPQHSAVAIKELILQGANRFDQIDVFAPRIGRVSLNEVVRVPGVVDLNNSLQLLLDQFGFANF